MFFESAAPLPPAVSPAAGDIAWLQHRLGRLWQLDPIASRLDAEALQGVRGAWGAAPDSASADQKARLILSLAAVRRPVPADVLDESSSLVVDLLRDHAESSDGPLVRTAAGLLQGLCPPLCDAASLRTAPIEEQAPVLLAQAAEDLRGIAALAAERTLRAVASLPSVAGSDGRPPSLAERPLLLQELPLESRFVGIGTAAWAATAHRPGAHFAVAPTAAAARIRTLRTALDAARAAQLGVIAASASAAVAASQQLALAAEEPAPGGDAAAEAATAAVGAAERGLASAEAALGASAASLLTALRGGKPVVLDPSANGAAAAASAAAAGGRRPPLRGPVMPAAVGRLAPSAAPAAGGLRNYKRRREGYEALEVGVGGGGGGAGGRGGDAASSSAAALEQPPPLKKERLDSGGGPAPAATVPGPVASTTPPYSAGAPLPAAAAAEAPPLGAQAGTLVPAYEPSWAAAAPAPSGWGAASAPASTAAAAAAAAAASAGDDDMGGLALSDLAGLLGTPASTAAAAVALASEDAAAAAAAAAEAASRRADAARLVALTRTEHASLLGPPQLELLVAFADFLAAGGPGAAPLPPGRAGTSELPLDAMSFRRGQTDVTGRNFLVLDWEGGGARKVFRKGLESVLTQRQLWPF